MATRAARWPILIRDMSPCGRPRILTFVRVGSPLQRRALSSNSNSLDLSSCSPWIDTSSCPASLLGRLGVQSIDLQLYPSFLNASEQETLVQAALSRLDASLSVEDRQARREWKKRHGMQKHKGVLPDEAYGWREQHFDKV